MGDKLSEARKRRAKKVETYAILDEFKDIKKSGKKYDHDFIMKVLELYERNNRNIYKTYQQTGLPKSTIKEWIKAIAPNKALERPPNPYMVASIQNMQEKIEADVAGIQNTKDQILQRIQELVPSVRNLDALARTFQVLDVAGRAKLEPAGGKVQANFWAVLTNAADALGKEKQDVPDELITDAEEVKDGNND